MDRCIRDCFLPRIHIVVEPKQLHKFRLQRRFVVDTMFSKLCVAAVATVVAAEDPSVTMFLDDSGHSASLWQDEYEFEQGVRRVMQVQTNELEKMVAAHPSSLLLQTEIATQKVFK